MTASALTSSALRPPGPFARTQFNPGDVEEINAVFVSGAHT
jgi:hypothetical protein